MLMRPSTKLRLLAWIAGGAMSLFVAGNAPAADCGCEVACDSLPVELGGCDCGCLDCDQSGGMSSGLHKFQDRLKKLCDIKWPNWKWCGDGDAACDDACDAAMMEDLMMSEPPAIHHQHVHPHAYPEMLPQVYSPPSETETISPPVHVREEVKDSELFNSLPDPFRDDDAQLQTQQRVQRSSHDEVVLLPVPRRPLSRAQGTSSRRVKSVR